MSIRQCRPEGGSSASRKGKLVYGAIVFSAGLGACSPGLSAGDYGDSDQLRKAHACSANIDGEAMVLAAKAAFSEHPEKTEQYRVTIARLVVAQRVAIKENIPCWPEDGGETPEYRFTPNYHVKPELVKDKDCTNIVRARLAGKKQSAELLNSGNKDRNMADTLAVVVLELDLQNCGLDPG
ncbi:hypothetical protein KBD11_00400 [Candidatus Saccharibacteria bacterium]|nr:hypothetical protein [Candidatus Saccharibacteria bacterium]